MSDTVTTPFGRTLKIGAFYWIWPVNDPDADEAWEGERQPARFGGLDDRGQEIWNCLGCEDSTWPVRWVGEEIVCP